VVWGRERGVSLSPFLQENHFGHFAIVTHWKEERDCGCLGGGVGMRVRRDVKKTPDWKIFRGSY